MFQRRFLLPLSGNGLRGIMDRDHCLTTGRQIVSETLDICSGSIELISPEYIITFSHCRSFSESYIPFHSFFNLTKFGIILTLGICSGGVGISVQENHLDVSASFVSVAKRIYFDLSIRQCCNIKNEENRTRTERTISAHFSQCFSFLLARINSLLYLRLTFCDCLL